MSKCMYQYEDESQTVSLEYNSEDGISINSAKLMDGVTEVADLLRFVDGSLAINPKRIEHDS